MKKNEYSLFTQKSILVREFCLTSILTSFAMAAGFFTDFIKLTFLNSFLSLNLSLVFIIPIIFVCNLKWSLLSSFVLGCFSFINFSSTAWIGPSFDIVLNSFVVSTIYVFYFKIFKNTFNVKVRILKTLTFSSILIILFACTINGFIFTPFYIAFFNNDWKFASFIELLKPENIEKFVVFTLGIQNYWLGIFLTYSLFNAIKFFVIFIISYVLIYQIIKNKFKQKYFLIQDGIDLEDKK